MKGASLCICLSGQPFLTTQTDEVLQLIFYVLLAVVLDASTASRRTHTSVQIFFFIHYGPIEAMYYVLGRGNSQRPGARRTCFLLLSLATASPKVSPLLSYAVSFRQVTLGAGAFLYASSFTL